MNTTDQPMPPLLEDREVAAILRCSTDALAAWRANGTGPAFVKVGGRLVRYRQADIHAFIEAARVLGASSHD